MKLELIEIADEHGASLGQLQRIAVSQFLRQYRKLAKKTRIFTEAEW
jgi:hypothetical protein